MRSHLAGLVIGLGVLVACGSSTSPYGGGGGGGGGGGHSTTITVGNNYFSPTPDTVPAGQVTFSWSGGSAVGHNVTWDTGPTTPANSATMMSGTYPAALQAGTYTYHCSIHGAAVMSGRIVVQ